MATVQGGSGVHIFNHSVYQYIQGMQISDIIVQLDEVPEIEVRAAMHEVTHAYIPVYSNCYA